MPFDFNMFARPQMGPMGGNPGAPPQAGGVPQGMRPPGLDFTQMQPPPFARGGFSPPAMPQFNFDQMQGGGRGQPMQMGGQMQAGPFSFLGQLFRPPGGGPPDFRGMIQMLQRFGGR